MTLNIVLVLKIVFERTDGNKLRVIEELGVEKRLNHESKSVSDHRHWSTDIATLI